MPKFRKRPVVVEAVRWTGKDSYDEVAAFLDCTDAVFSNPLDNGGNVKIPTLEGTMRADVGDWIIKGVKGEFYPCRDDIFQATYEPVEGA